MQGSKKVIDALNVLVEDELAAVLLYHALSAAWRHDGFGKVADGLLQETLEETVHARRLAARVLLLAGAPSWKPTKTPSPVPDATEARLRAVLEAEENAVREYRDAVKLACSEGDYVSECLLREILEDEEHHVEEVEREMGVLAKIGEENWLTEAVG